MRLLLLPILLGCLTACATVEDVASISYSAGPAALVPLARPVALGVVDGRTADRNRISTKINGFGMEMAAIRSARPVPDIVRDAMTGELQARGFANDPSGRSLTVAIDRFYSQFHVGAFAGKANGEVGLTVSVANRTGVKIFSRSYAGASEVTIMLASGSNAAEAVAAALKDTIARIFADPDFIGALTSRDRA